MEDNKGLEGSSHEGVIQHVFRLLIGGGGSGRKSINKRWVTKQVTERNKVYKHAV